MEILYTVVIAYLLGSILSAVILSKLLKFPDPRQHGSKNPGTSNVFRTAGVENGIFVLLGDILKGSFAIIITKLFIVTGPHTEYLVGVACLSAVIGHLFPLWFRLKGGKGVATFLGCLLAVNLWAGLLAMAMWAVIMGVFRIASIASLGAILSGMLLYFVEAFRHSTLGPVALYLLIATALIILKHKDNIQRLRSGNENKV